MCGERVVDACAIQAMIPIRVLYQCKIFAAFFQPVSRSS